MPWRQPTTPDWIGDLRRPGIADSTESLVTHAVSRRARFARDGGGQAGTEQGTARPAWPSQRQQAVEHSRISAHYIEDLRPACLARYQSDSPGPNTECLGYSSESSSRGPAVHGRGADSDDQRAAVLASHARVA